MMVIKRRLSAGLRGLNKAPRGARRGGERIYRYGHSRGRGLGSLERQSVEQAELEHLLRCGLLARLLRPLERGQQLLVGHICAVPYGAYMLEVAIRPPHLERI